MKPGRRLVVLSVWAACGLLSRAEAEDWPMWRHDANRTAATAEQLPADLALRWTRVHPARVPVWDDILNQDLMPYDRVFEPVVLGGRLFVGFNDRDKVVALDLRSGRELWTFYADGPVRLAPVAWRDHLYFASDDGHLYCLRAEDGSLRWKFRGAPAPRKALGNRRVISAWPARGGPVLRDGTIYFAASIWPFMGTFLHALDAATGRVVWTNDGTGASFIKQPHNAPAFAGVAPQGALVATEKYLVVPGGRSVPAVFDRRTGEQVHFRIAEGGKGTGGSFVVANETDFFVHTRGRGVLAFDLPTGKKGDFALCEPVLSGDTLFSLQEHPAALARLRRAQEKVASAEYVLTRATSGFRIVEEGEESTSSKKPAVTPESARQELAKAKAALEQEKQAQADAYHGPVIQALGSDRKVLWELPVPGTGDLIRAGNRLYLGAGDRVLAVDLPQDGAAARLAWSAATGAPVARLLAAQGHLIVVTADGRILAFGAGDQPAATWQEKFTPPAADPAAGQRVRALLAGTDVGDGYALCFGLGDGRTLDALLAGTRLQITVVEPDGARVEAARRRYDAAGHYGTRVSLHAGDARQYQAPPYIASLVVVGDEAAARLADPGQLAAMYESVRPYGGVLWIPGAGASVGVTTARLAAAGLPKARVAATPHGTVVVREGALPGAADWTHQYGNVANTVKSNDRIVRLPLGVLWFGGNTHHDVLPRHGHGPSEQVVGGRLFIEGMDCLSARDVYTGRVLWKTPLPNLGTYGVYWDATHLESTLTTLYSQVHIAGANARGTNYVATADEVYVVTGSECQVLDSRTGRIGRTIRLPAQAGEAKAPEWGYLGLCQDVLLAGAGFAHYTRKDGTAAANALSPPTDLAASAALVAFDRATGAVRWRVEARHSFWHNGIVAGNGRVYCLDRLPKSEEGRRKRRGLEPPSDYRIVAYDLRTGRQLWESNGDIFGTWLGYSETHDRLLQAGASASDRLGDEAGKGMITYRGADGTVAWKNLDLAYTGPCILHQDLIITSANSYKNSAGAFNLLDGRPHLVPNPLTGRPEPWKVSRTYGCNYIVASEHLLTFRSGAAGFYDLENHSGTGNLGGFKSGCSPNLIVADGVLNAPDYTRTCSCAYQNQTSLAFVHMPELEVWTYSLFGTEPAAGEPITRLGLNLGAPGDRRSETGTLWLEYPATAGTSAKLAVTLQPERPEVFLRHASQLSGEGPAWVVASGLRNVQSLTVVPRLGEAGAAAPQVYTVRLYFAEPDELAPGERVFDVLLQDQPVLPAFDVVQTAGAPRRGVVREFRGIAVGAQIALAFRPTATSRHPPILCGVELVAESAAITANGQ